jgi:hypothetical protein
MILLLALAVAFSVGLLRGGRLSLMAPLPLRWPAVPVLAFGAQVVVIFFPESYRQGLSLHTGLLSLSYLALLLTAWVNRRVPGMVLLALGLLLNVAVMSANGGYMPITPETMQRIGHANTASIEPGTRVVGSKDVALPREQTRLWVLSDILILPPPFPIPSACSPGDVLIAAGAFLIVQRALLGLPASGAVRRKIPHNGEPYVPTGAKSPGRHGNVGPPLL